MRVNHGSRLGSHYVRAGARRAARNLGGAALCAATLFAGLALSGAPAHAQGQNQIVAELETAAPASTSFYLRGTLPVPKGTYPRPDGLEALSILDFDDTVVPTQVEVVTRYPDAKDGADVVEVIGKVRLPPGAKPGDRLSYSIMLDPHPRGKPKPGKEVLKLTQTPGTLMVVGEDVFGFKYGVELYEPGRALFYQGRARMLRNGVAAKQIATYGTMLPATTHIGAPSGALAHLFGVHAYLTGWSGEDVLSLDLRINNGASGLAQGDPTDNPLGDVYFKKLELWVPKGWNVVQHAPDPVSGSSTSAGPWTAYSLVEQPPGGKMNFMPHSGQFHRRLALCKLGNESAARAKLDEEGLGFCVRGVSKTSGLDLWSWWNPKTARYYPQRNRLPELDHVGAASLRAKHDGQLAAFMGVLQSGKQSPGVGSVQTDRLGWAQPWGDRYGGTSGGSEIYLFDGLDIAEGASVSGYRYAQLVARTYLARQPNCYYDLDGSPTSVEEWLQTGPAGPYMDSFFYQVPTGNSDPFGLKYASPHQVNYVQSKGLAPAYETELRKYKPIDLQHYVRFTRTRKTLAWLGNDALSIDELDMCAEIYRMSYHPYANSPSGQTQGGGMAAEKAFVAANPGRGFGFGREDGWGGDAVVAAYAFANDKDRARLLPWFQDMADLVLAGQTSCNGFLSAKVQSKHLGGQYYMRQQFENAIVENMLRGVSRTVLDGVDPARDAEVRTVLANAVEGMVGNYVWDSTRNGPWGVIAVAPLTISQPAFCTKLPSGGTGSGVDKFQCISSFAYGFEESKDPLIMQRATEMYGGADLQAALRAPGMKNIENSAALLAFVQEHGIH